MAVYSPEEKARMIALAGEGLTWDQIGAELGRTGEACQRAAGRMRERGEWPRSEDDPREIPTGPGRPPNRIRPAPVSVRFAEEIAAAIRAVEAESGFRVGQLFNEAVIRAVQKARGERRSRHPLGLKRSYRGPLKDAQRTKTISGAVEADKLAELIELQGPPAMQAVANAAHALLTDLGYTIEVATRRSKVLGGRKKTAAKQSKKRPSK